MVRHTMNRQQLLFPFPDNASQIFMELLIVSLVNQALPTLDREDNLDIDLRIGVGHHRDSLRPAIGIKRKMLNSASCFSATRRLPLIQNVSFGSFNYVTSGFFQNPSGV